ncbi:MAG: Ig-like domain-containing protein, partial [Rivularia sp. ALOHA_DT_140]|nr:Ig-like domain-containing protein [Rivularia sp. ALOHA_DT_140]
MGSGNITGIAHEGSILYTMNSSRILKAFDISSGSMVERGSLTLPDGGGKLFVGNGIAYAPAISNFSGGFATANISDPDNITLISGSDVDGTSTSPGTAIAVNGSGLGLLVGRPGGTQANVLNLMDISDPSETNVFLNRIDLPTAPESVAIASGIAFVADGSSGLQVINYLGFDNQGQAPTVTITSPNADLDADVEGIQVLEGSSLPIQVDVEDDVQVRNVELLVNGEVVSNDVSFPFDLTATALNDDPEATTVDVQVRATDTGGNSTLSNTLTFYLVPDTFAPNVISTSPKADGRRKNISGISVRFDEPIDTRLLDLSGITLTNLGADEAVGGGDDTNI